MHVHGVGGKARRPGQEGRGSAEIVGDDSPEVAGPRVQDLGAFTWREMGDHWRTLRRGVT